MRKPFQKGLGLRQVPFLCFFVWGTRIGACPSTVSLRRLASLVRTLRWARFLSDEKSGKESLRAFPPKNPPWGTGLVVRHAYGRPWFRANSGKQLLLARRTARQAVRCLPSRALVRSVAAVPGCRKPGFRRLGTAAAPRKGPDKDTTWPLGPAAMVARCGGILRNSRRLPGPGEI